MAEGTRGDLWLMAGLLMQPSGLGDVFLTPEEAAEMERKGYRVARIPVGGQEKAEPDA